MWNGGLTHSLWDGKSNKLNILTILRENYYRKFLGLRQYFLYKRFYLSKIYKSTWLNLDICLSVTLMYSYVMDMVKVARDDGDKMEIFIEHLWLKRLNM